MPITQADRYYISEALKQRIHSQDPARPVGAVIVDKYGELISAGSNVASPSMSTKIAKLRTRFSQEPSSRYFLIEHAERQAIWNAIDTGRREHLRGATMYVTLFPCADCARAVARSGIKRIVVPHPSSIERNEKWAEHFRYAMDILSEEGVLLDTYVD